MDKGPKKRKRDTFDKREKAIFWNIVKTSNRGKIWKVITEGTSNVARHDAWVIIAQAFGDAISKIFRRWQAERLRLFETMIN